MTVAVGADVDCAQVTAVLRVVMAAGRNGTVNGLVFHEKSLQIKILSGFARSVVWRERRKICFCEKRKIVPALYKHGGIRAEWHYAEKVFLAKPCGKRYNIIGCLGEYRVQSVFRMINDRNGSRQMEYTTLGKTGLSVSRMGFGGIPIQKVDASVTHALMERLAQRGVNYIDTARGYTVSEQFLGEALEGGLREKFVVATKSMARTKEAMARDIDISLKNLRTDYIDLYQIHNPSLAELEQVIAPGGALEALMEAKAAGKIRHLGLTAHMAAVFERALELDWVETVMFPYNIVETQGEELMAKCREKNVGFICMKPMAGGALEDARLALRFIRQNENVSVVIPGMYDIREIDENLAAVEDTSALTEEELLKIQTIRRELGTQFCRRCNYCQPCTAGISISGIFVLEGYLQRYGLGDWAQKRYDALNKKAGDCVGCGACEKRCPYQLPIRQMLARCKQEFGS